MVIAIISGGINTFLEDKFPDFRDYVDFVFINTLVFSASGALEGVRATAFDFVGKAEALDIVCERVGCSPAEAVFVGDQFNDETIMVKVSRAIAYPPHDTLVREVAQEAITEDNLLLVLRHILDEETQPSDSTSDLRDRVFISYSHLDEKWLKQLQSHLSPLLRHGEVAVWADTRIEPRQEWRQEIQKAIKKARVAVLLISPNFLASDFIAEQELSPLLLAAKEEGLRVLWVPISECLYEETEIAKYQAASPPDRPLDSLRASDRNRQLAKIAREIKKALDATA